MGNSRNRKRKKARIAPCMKAKKLKHGEPSNIEKPGPSEMKIGDNSQKFRENPGLTDSVKEGIVFMDLGVLFNVFDDILRCPECGDNTTCHVHMKKKNGFSHYLLLECNNAECEWKYCFHTSKKQGHSYEINVRSVLAFREIGRGHKAMVTFAKVMNMPPPPTPTPTPTSRTFTKLQNKKLLPVVKQLATDSMVNNAMAVKEACNNEAGECGISLDGTWQRRGHVSHNGVVTAISLDTKGCLDVEILSDKCQGCQKWLKKVNDPKYQEWKANRICKINHTGSANSMQTAGALRIFERSYVTRGLRYKDMLW